MAKHILSIPDELEKELDNMANAESIPTAQLIRTALKLLLTLYTLQKQGGKVIIRQGESERELTLF